MTKRTARFHVRKTRSGEYRPYLRAANGEIVAGTETYTTKTDAKRWAKNLARWATKAAAQPFIEDDNQKES